MRRERVRHSPDVFGVSAGMGRHGRMAMLGKEEGV